MFLGIDGFKTTQFALHQRISGMLSSGPALDRFANRLALVVYTISHNISFEKWILKPARFKYTPLAWRIVQVYSLLCQRGTNLC
jgi:hypothetical protein